ncbi:hypothetical protein EH2_01295 [Bacillus subtilis]|nr:hypothetical protein EH2_01295 [Bacillus subtilis]
MIFQEHIPMFVHLKLGGSNWAESGITNQPFFNRILIYDQ